MDREEGWGRFATWPEGETAEWVHKRSCVVEQACAVGDPMATWSRLRSQFRHVAIVGDDQAGAYTVL